LLTAHGIGWIPVQFFAELACLSAFGGAIVYSVGIALLSLARRMLCFSSRCCSVGARESDRSLWLVPPSGWRLGALSFDALVRDEALSFFTIFLVGRCLDAVIVCLKVSCLPLFSLLAFHDRSQHGMRYTRRLSAQRYLG